MITIELRGERAGDEAAIRAVNDAAFDGPLESGIVDALRGSRWWIDGGSIVAVDEHGSIVGHLLLSRASLVRDDGTSGEVWTVGPVAVVPERQRQGVGTALMWHAIALATDRGQAVLCLLGHAEYYPRFGFEPARAIGLEAQAPWRDANWMALRLPAWTPDVRGTVRYAPAFPPD